MRFMLLTALVACGVAACGGDKNTAASQAQAAAAPAAAVPAATAPAPASGSPAATPAAAIVEVKMTGNGTSQAAFVPNKLAIAKGATVRFLNVSGGPHNIAFYAESSPKGGAEVLKKGMPTPMADLMGPFLTQPNEKYDVSFAGAPAGTYKGYCMPHVALGMTIAITVQ